MDETRARDLLVEQIRRMDADTATEQHDAGTGDGADTGVGDVADQGSDAAASMDHDRAVRTLRRRRGRAQAALSRLEEGTFGACQVCGARIDDERLEIRPETEFCRDHAERETA